MLCVRIPADIPCGTLAVLKTRRGEESLSSAGDLGANNSTNDSSRE